MTEHRTIAVMGATGRQGRGVVDALLFTKGDIEYHVRPLTRSLTSALAQRFTRDYPQLTLEQWKVGDVSSLQKCFEGCYGAFVDSGILLSSETAPEEWREAELALGRQICEAAEKSNLKHIIYPTFPSISQASGGHLTIPHFETKHQISQHIQSSPVPSTILCPGPFYTDFNDKNYASWDNGVLVFSTPAEPTKRMGWSDPGHDIGWFARACFDKGAEFMSNGYVPVSGPSLSYEEVASGFMAVTGTRAEYRQCEVDRFGVVANGDSNGDGGRNDVKGRELRALGEWLSVAPDGMTCYGTIEVERLNRVKRELRVEALSWEKFLERTGWRGPQKPGGRS
ncbi:hypothetical protein BKA65DRAFT_541414 [Rhexocercosporidium sp. MPI-PUGE-AT-0058]|nr:hypothetical protein BKA65DRAFT_541414 [Rhexocercosporidium sp. MPI-PUGE-AT-0058]